MVEGRYLYCITEADASPPPVLGLLAKYPYIIKYKDLGAVVSLIPYVEPTPNIENIVSHEDVVNSARKAGTVLPVKFGVIFKNEEGVKALLRTSYDSYRAKLDKFRDLDEYGIKVVLKTEGLKHLREEVAKSSAEISRMQRQMAKAKSGRSYFLKLKVDEAIKAESYRAVDKLARQVHADLAKNATKSSMLKAEHQQIILNAAYLVKKEEGTSFMAHARTLAKTYAQMGLLIHTSGPWAPYSFVEEAK